MKIVYIGGYSDKENSHFTNLATEVKKLINSGKNIVFVNFAMDAGYFNDRLKHIYNSLPSIIDGSTENNINWEIYDLIYIPGGSSEKLKLSLEKYGFDLTKLKKEVILIVDSAGANMLSKYYIGTNKETAKYSLENGFNLKSNILLLPHVDNSTKTPANKIEFAKTQAKEKKAELLLLKENEIAVYENGKRKDVTLTKFSI